MPNGSAFPIIYVRGFAGGTSGIDTATDDPFNGFNAGGTHVRVGGDGNPQFYQFEGPLVRLMEDEDYRVPVHGGQQAYLSRSAAGSQPRTSVWVYRFYDPDADTFGAPAVPYDLPTAARNLLAFVQLVLAKTDFTDPDGNPGDKKVWLVAHSMGGLICRSMIQKMCPDNGIAPGDLVDKLFTYATPHNGIDFGIFGLNIGVPQIAPFDAQIFNRKVMYQYLTPAAGLRQAPGMPDGWNAHVITGLNPSRVFCLIGTNAADYGAVSKAVGPKSDGLVQIDNAYVKGANRAFVHRSHSGRYGEVNSEEGYQNLRRFLFGTRKATVRLVDATLPAVTSAGVLDVWQAEVSVSIRGLPVLMDDQTAAHYCPVELGKVAGAGLPGGAPAPSDDAVTQGTGPAVSPGGLPLTTVFLLDPARARQQQRENLQPGAFSPRCRYSLQVKVIHLQEQHGLFTWQNHLEGTPEWADTLIVDVGPDDDDGTERLWAAWEVDISKVTSVPDPIVRAPLAPDPPGSLSFTIPLPSAGQQLLGARAAIALNVELLSP